MHPDVSFTGSVGPGPEVRHAQRGLHEGIEAACLERRVEIGEQSLHESEVDRADDVAVRFGNLTKWAVMQQDLLGAPYDYRLGRETDVIKDAHELLGARMGIDVLKWSRALREVPSPRLAGLECGLRRLGGLRRDVTGENLGQEPVAAPAGLVTGDAGGVQRARPTGLFTVLGGTVGHSVRDECVEMEADCIGVQPYLLSHLDHAEGCVRTLQYMEHPGAALAEHGTWPGVRPRPIAV